MRRREFIAITAGATAVAAARLARAATTPCPAPAASIQGGQSVTTTCPNTSGSAPAWFTSMADLTWAAPASNWLGGSGVIDPLANSTNQGSEGQSAVINDWTGMGLDQTRNTIFMLANGGHAGYYGNEVYALDLRQDPPAWVRRRNATASQTVGPAYSNVNVSVQNDGRPGSDHSSMNTVAGGGRWFKCGFGGTCYDGNAVENQWFEYSPFAASTPAGTTISGQADDWINLGSGFSSAKQTTAQCGAVYDPIKSQIIKVHGGWQSVSVEYVSLTNLAVTQNTNGLQLNGATPGLDTTNGILLVRADGASPVTPGYAWLNYLTHPTGTWSWLSAGSISGDIPTDQAFHWHAPSQAFLTWHPGTGLWKMKPTISGGGYTALAITSTAASGTQPVMSSAISGGMRSKVQLVNDMGNGQSALVVVSQYGNPDTYVLKIPAGGV